MNRKENIRLVAEELSNLPENFFGVVELHFHRGALSHLKQITSKKFNDNLDRKTGEDNHGRNR
jgi:hypothetical protein